MNCKPFVDHIPLESAWTHDFHLVGFLVAVFMVSFLRVGVGVGVGLVGVRIVTANLVILVSVAIVKRKHIARVSFRGYECFHVAILF